MKGLKCTTQNCEHNDACRCLAGVIHITRRAVCESKQKREYGRLDGELSQIEVGEEFDFETNEDVLIQCDSTKCAFNKNNICASDFVAIGDSVLKTKCFTKRVY